MKNMRNPGKVKMGLAVFAFVLVIAFVVVSGLRKSWVYYLTVDEIPQKVELIDGKSIKVSGVVVPGSIVKNAGEVTFEIEENGAKLLVEYEGLTLPEAFGESIPVIAEGVYDRSQNRLHAQSILTKCPSKYEAQVEASGN